MGDRWETILSSRTVALSFQGAVDQAASALQALRRLEIGVPGRRRHSTSSIANMPSAIDTEMP